MFDQNSVERELDFRKVVAAGLHAPLALSRDMGYTYVADDDRHRS